MEEKIYQLLDLIKKNGDVCPDYEKIKDAEKKSSKWADPCVQNMF